MATQTTEQLVAYYANLLIFQYISQLRAYNTVFVDVEPILMPQGFAVPLVDNEGDLVVDNEGDLVYNTFMGEILPLALQDIFTLTTAVGVQLDILAKYIGGLRTNLQLNGTFFTMSDAQFVTYLQILAARNGLTSDLGTITAFFKQYFPDKFSVYDSTQMQMTFEYRAVFGADPIAEAFIMSGHLPVPMAVGVIFLHNTSHFQFFAFGTYNGGIQPGTSGYNLYNGPTPILSKFLSYTDTLLVPIS